LSTNILVFGEQRGGKLHPACLQAMNVAAELASASGGVVWACVVGHNVTGVAETLAEHGAALVVAVDDAKLALYRAQPYASAVQAAVEKAKPGVLLLPATFMGKDLAPRLAARLGAALATDCTEVGMADGRLRVRRPVYNGKASCELRLAGDRLRIVSLRPNAFPAAGAKEPAGKIEPLAANPKEGEERLVCREIVRTSSGVRDVSEADIIVSGGRSLKSEANFKIVYELAEALDAAVGASRAACDAGYQPHSRQVGLTGKTVTPKLYVACGIDGAIQHLAGMRGSKVIVAINTKKEAPIFQVATYGCVADLFALVPLITQEVRRLKGQ